MSGTFLKTATSPRFASVVTLSGLEVSSIREKNDLIINEFFRVLMGDIDNRKEIISSEIVLYNCDGSRTLISRVRMAFYKIKERLRSSGDIDISFGISTNAKRTSIVSNAVSAASIAVLINVRYNVTKHDFDFIMAARANYIKAASALCGKPVSELTQISPLAFDEFLEKVRAAADECFGNEIRKLEEDRLSRVQWSDRDKAEWKSPIDFLLCNYKDKIELGLKRSELLSLDHSLYMALSQYARRNKVDLDKTFSPSDNNVQQNIHLEIDGDWPSEKFDRKKYKSIVEFLEKHWIHLIQGHNITRTVITKIDLKAAYAIDSYIRKHGSLPAHVNIPTRREVYDNLTKMTTIPASDASRVARAMRRRTLRFHNK